MFNDNKTFITIKCFNRPIYLYRVLKELALCNNIQNYPVYISCDHTGDINTNMQIAEALNLSGLSRTTQVQLVFQDKKLGCAGNTTHCLDYAFTNKAEYCIHLEDDTLPSQVLLKYFEFIRPHLEENNSYFAGCTFHRPCHKPERIYQKYKNNDLITVIAKPWFDGTGGFSITCNTWEEIKDKGGLFAVNYVSERGREHDCTGSEWLKEINKTEIGGFVYPMQHYFRESRSCLFPSLSLVYNIGRLGTHADPRIYEQIHDNPLWIGTGRTQAHFTGVVSEDTPLVEYGMIEK